MSTISELGCHSASVHPSPFTAKPSNTLVRRRFRYSDPSDIHEGTRRSQGVVRATAVANRREPDELHGMIEDMVKVLDTAIQGDLRKGRYPDRKVAKKIADIMRSIAAELEA